MEAIIIATGVASGMGALQAARPVQLVPLVDRPFLQHVVEHLIDQGITLVRFVVGHHADPFEAVFGDGTRWGCRFQYHVAEDDQQPYDLVRELRPSRPEEPVLLVHGDELVESPLTHRAAKPLLFYTADGGAGVDGKRWTGWAWIDAAWLAEIPRGIDRPQLETHLVRRVRAAGGTAAFAAVRRALSLRTLGTLLAAHWDLLEGRSRISSLTGQEREAGVRLGHNVTVKPGARLIPPVFVGENVFIGRGATVGPHVVVGKDCVVDSRTSVQHSLILPDSYVGADLTLRDMVVDRDRLIDVHTGAELDLGGTFHFGDMTQAALTPLLSSFIQRAKGAVLRHRSPSGVDDKAVRY